MLIHDNEKGLKHKENNCYVAIETNLVNHFIHFWYILFFRFLFLGCRTFATQTQLYSTSMQSWLRWINNADQHVYSVSWSVSKRINMETLVSDKIAGS